MKKIEQLFKLKRVRITALALLLAIILGSTAYSWYFYERRAAASAPVDSPVSIYINAAHKEDLQYLDLSGIDMERAAYQDFIFSVQGEDIRSFKLQLAYTTNNQLSFEIFEATESSGTGGLVQYHSDETGADYSYDILGSALPLRYLNASAGDRIANSNMHTETYGSYDNVNTYAEPIYCQTQDAIAARNRVGVRFHNYFILRVSWPAGKHNDRETDLLYIAAKAGT